MSNSTSGNVYFSYIYLYFIDINYDLKIFHLIKSMNDCFLLQNKLDNLVLWFNLIALHLNINKCQSVFFFRSRTITTM